MIPYGSHLVDEEDIDAVVDVLKNKFLTQGELVPKFEQAIADYTDVPYCTAVNSGTSALHIACLALGVGTGDLVWTVPNSFVASANCARYCGAGIDFVDIDAKTRNISVEALEGKLKTTSRLPKVLIVVHFSGFCCDMKAIKALCDTYGIAIIEDAAHAFGGRYLKHPIGNCDYSDVTAFSFHPVKTITSAEGGAVTTKSEDLHVKLQLFAKHGVTRDTPTYKALPPEPWVYEQHELGFNYRLSDLHAALGLSQIKKTDEFVTSRRNIAALYESSLQTLPIERPNFKAQIDSAWHLYVIELVSHNRAEIFAELRKRGIGVNVHYIPIHLQPYYQSLGFREGNFPVSEQYYNMALSLPIFPSMTENQQQKVIAELHEVLS